MQNGLYKVIFQTSIGKGSGVVAIENGTIKGGDSGMYYIGTYIEIGNQLTAVLNVRRHSNVPMTSSVFGMDNVTINLAGISNDNSALVRGTTVEINGIQFKAQLDLLA